MYGMESGQEFLAGWTDGMLAAKVAMRNAVRRELLRYALELTPDDGVVAAASPDPAAEKVPGPDNPLGDQDYADGWERGFREGHGAVATALRAVLAHEDLILSDTGNIVTARLASILIDWFRSRVDTADVSDETIHAFIDGATEDAVPPPGEAVSAPSTVASEPPARQRRGVWTMIRRNLDRRAALAAFSGALAMGTLGWFAWTPHKDERPVIEQAQLPSGLPPTPAIWNTYPADLQQSLMAIHTVVSGFDQAGDTPSAIAIGHQVMGLPSSMDGSKLLVVNYVRDTQRGDLLPALFSGLSPATSGRQIRVQILLAVRVVTREQGAAAVPAVVRSSLRAYQSSQVEFDAGVLKALGHVLSDLGG